MDEDQHGFTSSPSDSLVGLCNSKNEALLITVCYPCRLKSAFERLVLHQPCYPWLRGMLSQLVLSQHQSLIDAFPISRHIMERFASLLVASSIPNSPNLSRHV